MLLVVHVFGGPDLVYLSFWMGTILETVTKFRAFGGSSRTNSGFVLLSPGRNLGTPAFGGPAGNPGNPQAPWKCLPEKERTLDKFWTFVGFPPFRRPQKPEIQEINGGLGWLLEKERTLQNQQILDFCGVPSISAVPKAGNPGNPQGPWKWLPEKERTLQNRQILGFCGVPSISAVPEAGNPGKSTEALEMVSGKGADSTKSTNFGLVWFPPCRRSHKPEIQENPQGPWKWLPEKERALQNRQILGFCGVPSISAVPEAGNL